MKPFSALCLSLITAAATLSSPLNAEDAARPMTGVDFLELPRIGGLSISPGGEYVLYNEKHVDWGENGWNKKQRILTLEGVPITIAPQAIGGLEEAPIWYPDGKALLLIAKQGKKKSRQAIRYDLASGTASQMFSFSGEIDGAIFLGGPENLLFESDDSGASQDNKQQDWSITPTGKHKAKALYLYNFTSKETKLFYAPSAILEGHSASKDGSRIIVRQRPLEDSDKEEKSELYLLSQGGKVAERLTNNNTREKDAALSPDGTHFAYIAPVNDKGQSYYQDHLFVQKIGEAGPKLLFPSEQIEVTGFAWDKSGDAIWVTGNSGLRTQLYRCDLKSGKLTQITRGDHVVSDWQYDSVSGRHIARIINEKSPGDIAEITAASGNIKKISNYFGDLSQRYILPRQGAFTWRAADGQNVEGLLILPLVPASQKPLPLITITHGGPRASAQFGSWNDNRYAAVMAAQGYAIFLPNHRGSTGYGDTFMRDMVGGYFRNSHTDVLSGIDALVKAGVADPKRLIKKGWSAGGHMTNKLITFTNIFAAASSGAGVADWISLYGESDKRAQREPWFGGSPWQKNAPISAYQEQSPVLQAWQVKTPTLFWGGEKDERVPPTQAILMYRAVQDAGAPSKLFLAPGEGHNFSKPKHQLFLINEELAWFGRYIGKPYSAVLPQSAMGEKSDTMNDDAVYAPEEPEE